MDLGREIFNSWAGRQGCVSSGPTSQRQGNLGESRLLTKAIQKRLKVAAKASRMLGQKPAFPNTSLRELAAFSPAFKAHIATYHKPICLDNAKAADMAQSKLH